MYWFEIRCSEGIKHVGLWDVAQICASSKFRSAMKPSCVSSYVWLKRGSSSANHSPYHCCYLDVSSLKFLLCLLSVRLRPRRPCKCSITGQLIFMPVFHSPRSSATTARSWAMVDDDCPRFVVVIWVLVSLFDCWPHSRKRSVTISSNSSLDMSVAFVHHFIVYWHLTLCREVVQSSPTKKFKKAIPGSPEYNAQPPVIVTCVFWRLCCMERLMFVSRSKTPKTIGCKLSFGS